MGDNGAPAPPPPHTHAEDMGPWTRSSDVTFSSLLGPPELMRRGAARRAVAPAGDHAARVATAPPPPGVADSRALVYRLYIMKHCVIMTPLVYVLVISRAWFAAQIHGDAPEALHAVRSLRWLYRGAWGTLLSAALAFALWAVRRPGVGARGAPSDALLTRVVVFDCLLSALNPTAVLEYAGRREVECPRAASMAHCLLRVYFPTTHLAFLTKWIGSSYPPQVVFASELFRTACFAGMTGWMVHTRDGPAAARAPAFLLQLAARACGSFALTLLTVAAMMPRARVDAQRALPQALLDATCPPPLRPARDACCALAAAVAAAGRAALRPLPHGAQLAAASASEDGNARGSLPPFGIAGLSLLIAILNNDLRLHAIGRMQVGLFWLGLTVQALTSEAAPPAGEPPWLHDAPASAGGRAVQPQLSWSDVEMDELIGQGSYATVHAARWRGTSVALKCWLGDGGGDAAAEASELAEAALLMTLRHPNILVVYGMLPHPRALVMERGVCTLRDLLGGEEACAHGLLWPRRVELARDVAAGVEFLHAHAPPIIHGDITCSNVLVAADGRCTLSDFGTSFVSAGASGPLSVCSVGYAAPEVLRSQPVRVPQAVDAYSFGVLLQRIATAPHRRPLDAAFSSSSGSMSRVLRSVGVVFAAERAGFQPQLPPGCPEEYAALVRACCAEAPAARPAFAALRRELDAAHVRAHAWPAPDW